MGVDDSLYLVIVIAIAMERIGELFISKRNQRKLLASGAHEVGHSHLVWMKLLHTSWFLSCLLEAYFRPNPTATQFTIFAVILFLCQLGRYHIIRELRGRWTIPVIITPDKPPVTSGLYKFFRHPNYMIVCVEILAMPLMVNAYVTAISFTLLNLWMLRIRIQVENEALGY